MGRDLRIGELPERGEPFEFEMDGEKVKAYTGESIAGALLAAGRYRLRKTLKLQASRGMFCSVGVCYECRVVVNGQPNVRACMTPAEPGLCVQTQEGLEAGSEEA
jgi:aerobic-type carbon monoxide dehydrogenase small subunit (CoxS/CutS family)